MICCRCQSEVTDVKLQPEKEIGGSQMERSKTDRDLVEETPVFRTSLHWVNENALVVDNDLVAKAPVFRTALHYFGKS